MDEHLYGEYTERCSPQRHPALSEWFSAPDSFAWLLGLTDDEFAEFNQASTAEILDLLAADLAATELDAPLLLDGGITNPALAAQVIPSSQIVCVATSRVMSVRAWQEDEGRRWMKEMALRLPDGEAAWRRFLHCDELLTETLLAECRESNIRIFVREEATSVQQLAQEVADYLRLQPMS